MDRAAGCGERGSGRAVSTERDRAALIRLFGRYLKDLGLPVTHQREVVADAVFGAEGHLSVDDIADKLRERGEGIGKATIYRTLDLLVRSRLVAEHDFGEGFKRYEHRLSNRPIHEHLICLECGKVVEFESDELFRVENNVRREYGFVPVRRRLEIYGLCKECHDAGVELPLEGLTCPIETV
jgi:Fur family ferric uptake transcriptional regulator